MSRRHTADDEDDDWDDDDSYGDDSYDEDIGAYDGHDSQADEDEPTLACPNCGREIHEEANQCPYCEQYVTPRKPKPWWLLVGAIVCLYLVWQWLW